METKEQTKPTIIKVVATNGGFRTFVAFLSAMFIFTIVFLVGIIAGIAGTAAATDGDGVFRTRITHEGDRTTIAVFNIDGIIDKSNAAYAMAVVQDILENKRIRAVVLRVDSPGGGVTASDEIWHYIQRFKDANIPLIASYGGIAASGGYYISCNADHIMAQETTITGSIGVIANIMTLQDLMTKIGVKPVTLIAEDSPEKSVANDIFRNWTNKDKQLVTGFLDTMYNVFLSRVKEGRSHVITDAGKLASVANGSAYTAQEALENGLIDSIGYLDDAILVAEQRTGVSNGSSTIVRYSRAVPVLGGLLGAKGRGMTATDLRSIIHEFSMPRLMYLYNQ